MSSQADAIIAAARKYLGVKESPPYSNNVIFNTAYYGRAVSGSAYPWCCMFVWYVFKEAGLSTLFYGGGATASSTVLMNWARTNNQFVTSGYKPGDVVFYNFGNYPRSIAEHVGIVSAYSGGVITSIEGNTSIGNDSDGGEVMERKRSGSVILGAYRPNYKEEEIVTDADFKAMYDRMMAAKAAEPASVWPNGEFDKAIKAGITDGTSPKTPATREQVAVMIQRATGK